VDGPCGNPAVATEDSELTTKEVRRLPIRAALVLSWASCLMTLPAAGGWEPAQAAEKGGHGPKWSYEGDSGPEHWGKLSEDWHVCTFGTQESPIDLQGAIPARMGELEVRYAEMPMTILNNGHTVQVNAAPGATLGLHGQDYELLQVHFHHPSEHLLGSRRFPMEAHFVHRGPDGGLAVVGVFIEEGAGNESLERILAATPQEPSEPVVVKGASFQPEGLLPAERGYLRYNGSLTTPPCTENVAWIVLQTPVQASGEQIARFAKLYPMNARPIQQMNRRFLLEASSN
jgi:carbonic anhydrase